MHAKLDLLLPKPYVMSRSGFTDAERALCVIWMTYGYGETAVQRLFGVSTAEHLQLVLWLGYGEQTTNNEELLGLEEKMDPTNKCANEKWNTTAIRR